MPRSAVYGQSNFLDDIDTTPMFKARDPVHHSEEESGALQAILNSTFRIAKEHHPQHRNIAPFQLYIHLPYPD
jgi:hypothetical protein